ncbi:serine hydrolase [Streptomyces sp. NPDC056144]|uniref:serine hydrolase n=1 Tax=unclassified Streptomyces TaxID=2593676 RepID=UPI0035DBD445
MQDATNSNVSLFGPAGAMVSTLDEQARFLQAVFSGQLLPAAQMATLRSSVPLDGAGQPGGMGANHWTYDCASGTKTFWSHGGNVIGYASRWFVSEDGGKAVVVMGNEYHGASDTQGQLALLYGARDALCAIL